MKKLYVVALATMLATPAVYAADMPSGSVAAYLAQTTLDLGANGGDDSGTGFGIRGWATIAKPWFVHGEYQTVSLDDFDADIESLRIGGGMVGEINPRLMWLAKGEYIDFGSDYNQAGFGVHGGVMFEPNATFGVGGTLGYITTDDTSGLEINVGGKLSFTREFAGVLDIRHYVGSDDRLGGDDFILTDLRIGVAYMF